MANSMADQLRRDMVCEGLLECIHGLRGLDTTCYQVIVRSDGPMTVDDVAERVDRERSTVYRSIQRLLQSGFVEKTQKNDEGGGYHHVYTPVPPSTITRQMQRTVTDRYAQVSMLIQEFEDRYADAPSVDQQG
ncbi:helix-turn-helix domain-containing protein [Natrarchaeobaculum aegyptiacum]|uniref:Transcriptional regulator n=1 Tax=Natrarchaeobaculum aegyptiacum TaxID=745377 RepID=A0A2Z2HXQ9_9EURY|nr:helix-turn-helix domain-containing protein [Natrarchaeobaculum aegyptiacum]ARS91045.1 transcriptional regulator [Natrarchaeobaculum aegyptiacum]